MTSNQSSTSAPQFRPRAGRLKAGGSLVILGGLLGAAGALLAGSELARASRRWLMEQEQPPSEMARVQLHRAVMASQAARQAAMDAWMHDGGTPRHALPGQPS